MKNTIILGALALCSFYPSRIFHDTPQVPPFTQNWSTTTLITNDDIWTGVPGIIGYRGDDLTAVTGADPQLIVADGSATPQDVNANRSDPNVFATGGIAEFDGIANPTVAIQGSGTADAPHLVIHLNTTGFTGVTVSYNVRDLDGSADNAVQQVALQYRIGNTGDYTNVPGGYIPDATTMNAATQVTAINVVLPPAADNQPLVQVRIITSNAIGNDEWVGIDDISITAGAIPITFIDFSARQSNSNVYLNWKAHSTDNISYFILERKGPGEFAEVTRLNAHAGEHSYQFIDPLPGSNVLYRLKMVDADGRFRYSPILHIQKGAKRISLNSIFPTIANDIINVQVSNDKKQWAEVEILDATGRTVRGETLILDEGTINYPVKVNSLSPGSYILRLRAQQEVLSSRFIKQ